MNCPSNCCVSWNALKVALPWNSKFKKTWCTNVCTIQLLRNRMSSISSNLYEKIDQSHFMSHNAELFWRKIYNHFHILRLFDVLPDFPFATSETMCDYYLVYTMMHTDTLWMIVAQKDCTGTGANLTNRQR